ncbi:MAG: PTS sugar transporter subunit IIA [Leptospirales bacterium]|nr:PTS sugar transporter subunit IIA [Leptospirales bacterium]
MDSILDALQEGHLFELPEHEKDHALQFLAHIIEAFPQIPPGTDFVEAVKTREEAMNTGLGKGWACSHARVSFEEDLMCVIGWSPTGIDYGAQDGKPVSIIIMYIVPSNQKNHYLREISTLVKAIQLSPDPEKLSAIKELNDVRNYLLDLIAVSKETGPDARARMIRLQVKSAAEPPQEIELSNLILEPVSILQTPDAPLIVLTHNNELMSFIEAESSKGITEQLELEGSYYKVPWRIVRKGITIYQGEKTLYECLALAQKRSFEGKR